MKQYSIKIFVFILYFLFNYNIFGFEVIIQVLNEKKQPQSDIRIILIETKEVQFTDNEGKAIFQIEKPGFYQLRIILNDGTILQPKIQVLGEGQLIPVYTSEPKQFTEEQEQIVSEEGVVVIGKRNKQKSSVYSVKLEEIKRIPGQFGEALRGIENLPGVNAPPFGNGDLALRGANEDSNAYYVDDLPIAYPYHLIALNSVLQNEFISSIDVYTGSYPVRYGDATGGVISIYTPDNIEKFGGLTTFSLWSSSVLFHSPIFNNNGYYIIGGRVSYLDQTLRSFIPDTVTLIPKYQDAQLKYKINLTQNQSLYFYIIGSRDSFIAKVKDDPFGDPLKEPPPDLIGASAAIDRDFITTALRHIYQPSSKFYSETTLLYYAKRFYIDASIGNISAKFTRTEGYGSLKNESSYEVLKDHLIVETGIELRNFIYKNKGETVRVIDPLNPNPNPYKTDPPDFEKVPVNDYHISPFHNAYLLLIIKNRWFEFLPGLRYEYFSLNKQEVLDPRGTFAIKITKEFKFIGGGGIYHRLPDGNEYSPTSGNPFLRFEKAQHSSFGFEYQKEIWTFRIEGFKQYFDDLVVGDPYITIPVKINEDPDIRKRIEEPILYNAPLYYSNKGDGYSYGVEVFIKKDKPPKKNGFYGWISYTHSISKRRDHIHKLTDEEKEKVLSANEKRLLQYYDNSQEYSADFDRRHIINFILGWKINSEYQLGLRWRYSTSPPYTEIIGDDGGITKNNGRPIFEPEFSETKNTVRLKPYHRLDIRLDKFLNYEWGYGNVYLELINVYIRENPGGFVFDKSVPYSNINPQIAQEFGNLVITQKDKKIRIPLFNIGIEVKF
ncbi:MAG: TonB-dependent receptor [Leptospiraceae bacterium]|nr:MAG: TonB-dependent receptor [Leptospiraceae bacterium]